MSRTTEFISELVAASNALDQHTDADKKRLLENAIGVIEYVRVLLGYGPSTTFDIATELRSVSTAVTLGWASDTQVRLVMLTAAGQIRDLSVELNRRLSATVEQRNSPAP